MLQSILIDRLPGRRSLYWRGSEVGCRSVPSVSDLGSGVLQIVPGGALSFDTYFNAFFEAQWWRYTTLRNVVLEVTLVGTALLRIHRHALGGKAVLVEQMIGPGATQVPVPRGELNLRQNGMLSFELCAIEEAVTFLGAAWLSTAPSPARSKLAVVFCTFNREAEISKVLRSLSDDPDVLDHIAKVIVVNQGRPDSRSAFGDAAALLSEKLTVIDQPNFGGAGGFSRGLLAALEDPGLTHAVLLDDDIELEPASLQRMATFFAYCERDIVLGGHMLDLLQPTKLYEAGAVISDRHWTFLPQHFMRDLSDAELLEPLSHPYAIHYNGWWCCGFPLAILRDHGMPLPCFIRGDDMEFGLRLHERDIPTISMPGIAVWHEPFYLKLGGWQLYYETRNTLVAAALHQPFGTMGVVRRMGRQIITHLLTYRYYSTALILEGIRDFLAGPSVFFEPPLPRHSALGALKEEYPGLSTRRERVSTELRLAAVPSGRFRCLALLSWLLMRNAVARSCATPASILKAENVHWLAIRKSGHIAVETWWDAELPTFRRCRASHRKLLWQAAVLVVRLCREASRAAAAWREAAPLMTSVPFWYKYLGVEGPNPECRQSVIESGVRLAPAPDDRYEEPAAPDDAEFLTTPLRTS